jgi:hypothetical protein
LTTSIVGIQEMVSEVLRRLPSPPQPPKQNE